MCWFFSYFTYIASQHWSHLHDEGTHSERNTIANLITTNKPKYTSNSRPLKAGTPLITAVHTLGILWNSFKAVGKPFQVITEPHEADWENGKSEHCCKKSKRWPPSTVQNPKHIKVCSTSPSSLRGSSCVSSSNFMKLPECWSLHLCGSLLCMIYKESWK